MRRFLFFMLICAIAGCVKTLNYGPYSIGRDPTWFPLHLNQIAPKLTAFTNAAIQEIAKNEGAPLQIINISWVQLFQALEEGEVAGIFTTLSPNVITNEKYTFSDPFVLLGPVLILPYGSTATSLDDLSGKIVAINQFDESVLIIQQYPSIVIKLYQNMPDILETLASGEIDGVLMPLLDAERLIPSLYPTTLKIASAPLNNKAIRLITLQGANHSLMRNFNKGLARLKSNGRYAALRKIYQID